MNNSYFPSSNNYNNTNNYPNQLFSSSIGPSESLINQSYIENILTLNKGKLGKFYCTFPDSNEWRDTVFSGVIEQAARDHLIISNPSTGKWYLIQMIYLNYCEFDEKINYLTNF
jgi:spore germination protein Q